MPISRLGKKIVDSAMTTLCDNESLTIVVISSLTTYSTAGCLISAFKKARHSVFLISDTNHPEVGLKCSGAFDLPNVLQQNNLSPDLVLFIEGGSMQIFPAGLDRLSCLSAWYGIDTHMNYDKHFKICRVFDISFIAQLEYVSQLRSNGITNVHWLPLAFDYKSNGGSNPQRAIDIAYIGSMQNEINPERHRLLARLKKEFTNSYLGNADPEEMPRIYSSSYLVFNRSIRNDVNMRFFEAMGSGAVLLTNDIQDNGAEQLFKDGIHYFTYQDEESLVTLAKDLLRDPERCKLIGKAAHIHALNHHTYVHRVIEIIRIINANLEKKKIRSEFMISALLVQGFVGRATFEVSKEFRQSALQGAAKWLAIGVASAINALAYLILGVEQIKRKLRKW